MRRAAARTGRGAATLHRHDRLAAGDTAGQPGELARVPERFEVQQDHVGVGVLVPVLDEVVAAHVGLVAHRHERRDAEPDLTGLGEQLDSEPTGLRRERDPAGNGRERREGGVEADVVAGVDDAHAVRADHPHAVRAGQLDELPLRRRRAGAQLREPGRDDHEPGHLLRHAVASDVEDVRGRHRDDHQVDLVGDVAHLRVGAHPGDRGGVRVDRVDGTGEVALEEVAEQRVTDRPRGAAGTHDRHRARREQPIDGTGLRDVLTGLLHLHRRGRRRDGERHLDRPAVEMAFDLEARVGEDAEHLSIVGEGRRHEPADPELTGDGGEVLEQDRAESAPLLVVLDGEGHLGVGQVGEPVEARHRDDVTAQLGDQREPSVVVEVGERLELAGGRRRDGGEEAEVQRLRGESLVQAEQRVGVLVSDRPQVHGAAVAEHHVRLPPRRVPSVHGRSAYPAMSRARSGSVTR